MKFIKIFIFFCFLVVILANSSNTKTTTENQGKNKIEAKLNFKNSVQSEAKSLLKNKSKTEIKNRVNSENKLNLKIKINLKANNKVDLKNKRSMMEFLNGLYSTNKSNKKVKVSDNKEISLTKVIAAENIIKKEEQSILINNKLPSKIVLPKKDEFGLILEDWLKISSPMFKNRTRFPQISMPDGSKMEIKVNHNFFRINSAFNDNNPDPQMPPDVLYFWFRLSGKNIYYSLTKSDINILGAIKVSNVQESIALNDYSSEATCFIIKDSEEHNWKLCADSIDIRNKWLCKIKEILMINDNLCSNKKSENEPTVIEKIVTQPIILIPLPSRMCNENWTYLNHGMNWECDCSEGKEQSPIDLPPVEKTVKSPIKPLFQYVNVDAKSQYSTIDENMKENENIKIKNVDGALRIFHKFFGKVVTLDGAVYNAEEIVFHTPAEHTINGKKYDMEMQVIHYGQTKGDIAKQVILTFLFEKKAGIYNKFIDDIDFFNLPNPVTIERHILNSLFIPKVFYSSDEDDIPTMRPFDFYTYQGSLSFPPCTERTIIYVAAKPIQIGTTALQLFHEALRRPDLITQNGDVIVSDNVSENNRVVQPRNGRPIFYYKSCHFEDKKVVMKPTGHYEKIKKEAVKYFYVSGEQPSGLPGSFVVSKKEASGNNF